MEPTFAQKIETRAGLGAVASVVQSGLFVVIAACALAIGIDRFARGGLAAMSSAAPGLFLVLCGDLWIARLFSDERRHGEGGRE